VNTQYFLEGLFMQDILTDFSPEAIITANEENLFAFLPLFHGWERAEVYKGADICYCVTDLLLPPCNVAFHANIKPENLDRTIEQFIAVGRKRNVPLRWYLGHKDKPVNLTERLAAHGFTTPGPGPGMAIDLNEMKEEPLPAGLKIIEVKDNNALKAWCHIACIGFGVPENAEPTMLEWLKRDIQCELPLIHYLGLVDDVPVATSMSYFEAGVVGIYLVATLPEARNKGIGFAITQKPLKDAKKLGYRIGTLQASQMGKPVYLRMGFKEYFQTGFYAWSPENLREKR
jgi:GNAT superfamily N-acetyltransferase